jgi:hypothetical protein
MWYWVVGALAYFAGVGSALVGLLFKERLDPELDPMAGWPVVDEVEPPPPSPSPPQEGATISHIRYGVNIPRRRSAVRRHR